MRWLLLVATGCGWTEARFETQGIERMCEGAARCGDGFTPEACIDVLRSTDRTACDYDPASARRCAADLKDASCAEVGTSLDLVELAIPESCLAVYDCDWIHLSAVP